MYEDAIVNATASWLKATEDSSTLSLTGIFLDEPVNILENHLEVYAIVRGQTNQEETSNETNRQKNISYSPVIELVCPYSPAEDITVMQSSGGELQPIGKSKERVRADGIIRTQKDLIVRALWDRLELAPSYSEVIDNIIERDPDTNEKIDTILFEFADFSSSMSVYLSEGSSTKNTEYLICTLTLNFDMLIRNKRLQG